MKLRITSHVALYASMIFGAVMAVLAISDAGQTAVSITAVCGGVLVAILWLAAGQTNSRERNTER